jgi:outer membrane protein TolC
MKNRLKHKLFIALLFTFARNEGNAQSLPLLTAEEALRIGLRENFAMQIDSHLVQAASLANSAGAAGFLPRLEAAGSIGFDSQNLSQEFSSGTEIDKDNVSGQSQDAGLYLTWTLFDGFNQFATARFLKQQEEQAKTVSRERAQNLMAEILNSYYAVVQRKQLVKLSDSSLKYYDVALNTARNLQLNGKGTRQQVLQAQIDRNAEQARRLLQENFLEVEKNKLNHLLQRNPETPFEVTDTIPLIEGLAIDTGEVYLRQHNPSLLFANRNVDVQTSRLQQDRSFYYPRLDLSGSYAYSNTSSDGSFFQKNQRLGWNAGVSLSWSLFDGFNTRHQVQIARINLENARLQYQQVLGDTRTQLVTAYRNYRTALEEMLLLRENQQLALENLQLATEQYKLFAITQIDLQRAHKSYDDAGSAYIASVYAVKLTETEVLRQSGRLLQ